MIITPAVVIYTLWNGGYIIISMLREFSCCAVADRWSESAERLAKPSSTSRSRLAGFRFQYFSSFNVKLRNPRSGQTHPQQREGGACSVVNLCKAVGLWRTTVFRYLSSLFFNQFGFIRHFRVESARTGAADIHKGHVADSIPCIASTAMTHIYRTSLALSFNSRSMHKWIY